MKSLSSTQKAYIAGFLDGDGSIYVRMKPNPTYKYGFQIAPHIVLFQSKKDKKNFQKVCSLIDLGYLRERKDGILEYIIGREDAIRTFLMVITHYLILKKEQFLIQELLKKRKNLLSEQFRLKKLLSLRWEKFLILKIKNFLMF